MSSTRVILVPDKHTQSSIPNPRNNAECPKRHKPEAEAMFPGLDVSDLLVVPTCQVHARSTQPLSPSPSTRKEKKKKKKKGKRKMNEKNQLGQLFGKLKN